MTREQNLIIGVSGASGIPYATELIRAAFHAQWTTHIIVSPHALAVIQQETDQTFSDPASVDIAQLCAVPEMAGAESIHLYDPSDLTAGPASGTFQTTGMVVVPCSMRTLGALAGGITDNLLLRAADCQLKEGRKLILALRETPLNQIHLENMLRLSRAGATILPLMPAYYYRPRTLADHERFIVSKICDQVGLEPERPTRWPLD